MRRASWNFFSRQPFQNGERGWNKGWFSRRSSENGARNFSTSLPHFPSVSTPAPETNPRIIPANDQSYTRSLLIIISYEAAGFFRAIKQKRRGRAGEGKTYVYRDSERESETSIWCRKTACFCLLAWFFTLIGCRNRFAVVFCVVT